MKHSFKTTIGILLLIAVTFSAGYFSGQSHHPASVADAQGGNQDRDELFAPFFESWDLLHANYVDPLDDRALMEAALNGMLDSLNDPHMGYIVPEDYQDILNGLNGEFEGIGATVQKDETTGALLIVRPLPDSPAEASGLMSGDEIVEVDGRDVTELEQDVIISLVRGPAGTDVVLGVRRNGTEELIEFTVTRAKINLPNIDHEILDGNIGYLQIFQFGPTSDEEVFAALRDMDADNLDGLIIDLRGNLGGYLDVTMGILSDFIDEGVLMIEETAGNTSNYEANGNAIAAHVPLVVLVDGNSASASEIAAGSLQDRGRATVIGTPTFGKASVQTWRRLSNGGGIRITIAHWLTPAGYSVTPDGIQPDIVVEFPPLEEGEVYDQATDPQLKAAIDFLVSQTSPTAYSIP